MSGFDSAADSSTVVDPGVLQEAAVRGSLWTMLHVAVSVPIAFIANAVVARALGVEDYGRLAVLTLALGIAVATSNAGVSDGVIQWGAAAHARGDRAAVFSLLQRSLGFHALVQLPVLLVFIGVIAHDQSALVVAALLVSIALPALLGSSSLLLTIENRTAVSAKLAMVTSLITQVVVSTTAVVTHSPPAVWAARSSVAAALIPANFLALDRLERRAALQAAIPRRMPVGFWSFSLFTAAGGLVGMLVFSRSELLVLQGYGAAQAAGLFALAFGLAQQVTAPVDALLNPLQPAVAGMVEAHGERVPEALLRATRVSSLLCAIITIAALPALFWLMPLIYGREFGEAAQAFLCLAVISCLQSAVNPLMTFTRARRRAGSLLAVNALALTIDLAVAMVAIPMLGLWGAVLANASGQLTVLMALVTMECRAWKIAPRSYGQASVIFLTAAAATLALVPADAVGAPPLLSVPGTVLAALAAVVVVARVTGSAIPESDLKPALDILPGRLGRFGAAVLRPVMVAGR